MKQFGGSVSMEIHTGFSLGMEWLWIEIQSPWQSWKVVLFLPLLTTHSGNTRSANLPSMLKSANW